MLVVMAVIVLVFVVEVGVVPVVVEVVDVVLVAGVPVVAAKTVLEYCRHKPFPTLAADNKSCPEVQAASKQVAITA